MTNSDEQSMMRELGELAERFHAEAGLAIGNAVAYNAAVRRFKSAVVELARKYFPEPDFWPLVVDSLLDVLAKPSMPRRSFFDAAAQRLEQSR